MHRIINIYFLALQKVRFNLWDFVLSFFIIIFILGKNVFSPFPQQEFMAPFITAPGLWFKGKGILP